MAQSQTKSRDTAKKPYHHGGLKEALIVATRQLVETHGAAHFSVAQAARQAGVSSGAPYRHFKDRDAMLDEVARDGKIRLTQRFIDVAAPFPEGSLDALTAIGLAYVAFADEEPAVFRLMFAEHAAASEATCAAGDACKMQLLRHVAGYLGHSEISEATHEAAFPLWTMVHGISFLRIDRTIADEEFEMPLEPMLRQCTEKLLRR